MKVPPLIINLKSIEKQDKHKEHKKHKKHKKHKHKHHHHDHEHSSHLHSHEEKLPTIRILNPPLLEPVGMPEPEHNHLYPYQSSYAPPSPPNPYPHVLHTIATPPSQREQRAKEAAEAAEEATSAVVEAEKVAEVQPPVLEDKIMAETDDDSKQPDDNQPVIEPPVNLKEAPPEVEKQQITELEVKKATNLQEPNSQLSFLKLSEDGGVRLNIIGPIKQADESNEKILNLEQICGQLQEGLDVIPSDINEEDTKEQLHVNPVEPIETPTFGSYLPIKDSTFANLTKEDSEALLEIYGGNEKAFGYAESLQNYASGTNYLMKMVDSLLDLLTEGRHNSEAVPIRQKLEEARKEEAKSAAAEKLTQNGDTLGKAIEVEQEEDKMEVDTAPIVENRGNTTTSANVLDEVQHQLNEIDTLLNELSRIQEQRLSSSPAPVEPNDMETNLANEVLAKMTKLIKEKAKPSEICESSSILKALGIPLDVNSEIKLAD